MAAVFDFFSKKNIKESGLASPSKDWSNQDLAHLYRVESALIQVGLRVETERGVTEEGDPWFVFCHVEAGDVIVHFARIDGVYIAAAPTMNRPIRGRNFNEIVQIFLSDNPALTLKAAQEQGNNIYLHPSALLTAFVAAMFYLGAPNDSWAKDISVTACDNDGIQHDNVFEIGSLFNFKLTKESIEKTATFMTAVVAIALEIDSVHNVYNIIPINNGGESDNSFDYSNTCSANGGFVYDVGDGCYAGTALSSVNFRKWALSDDAATISGLAVSDPDNARQLLGISQPEKTVDLARIESVVPVEVGSHENAAIDDRNPAAGHSSGAGIFQLDRQIAPVQRVTITEGHSDAQIKALSADWIEAAREFADISQEVSGSIVFQVMERMQNSIAAEKGAIENDNAQLSTSTSAASSTSTSTTKPSTAVTSASTATKASGDLVFDDGAAKVIAAFIKTSDDIEYIIKGTSVVIFDESDVLNHAENLDVVTWRFVDSTTISIVGASNVVDAVMHMTFS